MALSAFYRPLSVAQQEIRLLEVELPKNSDILHCTMKYASFQDDPQPDYETISYCWGDPTRSSKIMLDGQILSVPRNTELALRRVILPERKRTLWIDAVCINQDDITERAHQVGLMGTVFSTGRGNLIYLGEGDHTANSAINIITDINEDIESVMHEAATFQDLLVTSDGFWNTDKSLSWERSSLYEWDSLLIFFDCHWLRRVWVMQEAVLAKWNRCFYGSNELDFDHVLRMVAWLRVRHRDHISAELHNSPGLKHAFGLWMRRNRKMGVSEIGTLMAIVSDLEASDPRDKVFGVLGEHWTSEKDIPTLLQPDYHKSMKDVYRDVTRYCIQTEGDLNILHSLRHRSQEEMFDEKFPSWVPKFDRYLDHRFDPSDLLVDYLSVEDTICEAEALNKVDPTEADLLVLRGYIVDRLTERSDILKSTFDNTSQAKADRGFLRDVLRMTTRWWHRNDLPSLQLARTLIADRDIYKNKSNEDFFMGLKLYIECLRTGTKPPRISELTSDDDETTKLASRYVEALWDACLNRRFAITARKTYALVPSTSQRGDVIAVVSRGRHPLLLRPQANGNYRLVGPCYVDGIMEGEAMKSRRQAGEPLQRFIIE